MITELKLKKNDELKLNIISLGINGEGVAKYNNAVIFVPYALPNETVLAKIIYAKSSFYIAKIIEILKPSIHRIEPPCPYFTKCGGCNLQHLNYEKQLEFKTQLVQNNFNNISKIDVKVNKTIGSNNCFYYRNKFSFPIGVINNVGVVGMYKQNSHTIIPIQNCLIQEQWAIDVINIFNKFLKSNSNTIYNEETKQGLIKHLVCRFKQNQLLLCIVINGQKINNINFLINELKQKFENFGISLNINTKNNNSILTNDYKHIFGLKNIVLNDNNFNYEININSFMQVNSYIENLIYNKICEEINDEIVVNSYSGAGYLTAKLSKLSKFVYGIEIIESAHINAEKLISDNNIKNVKNICGDVKEKIKEIKNFNSIILDPPRKGCDKSVIETINIVAPNKIVYLSCDSATLCRDLKSFSNYTIKYVQPFDMFPQTKHVETLVVLTKRV